MLLAAGCGKKAVPTAADATPAPGDVASGPRIMPAVAADYDQLMPEVPAGYTACTKTVFDPRIDPKTATERLEAWKGEAAKFPPSLHPVDVRDASGVRDDDATPDDKRQEGIVTLPRGVLEMRFPGRLSTIRTARRAAKPEYERNPDAPSDFVRAPLGVEARVMIGGAGSTAVRALRIQTWSSTCSS